MSKCITYNQIPNLIKRLSEDYDIYYPIKLDSTTRYTNDISQISDLNLGLSHISPKQFFLPAFEDILFFDKNYNQKTKPKPKKKKIYFGIHPFDVKALTILDKHFNEKYPDQYWNEKRSNSYIIGIGDFIFKDFFKPDIFLHQAGDTFEVINYNPKTKHLLDFRKLFSKTTFKTNYNYYPIDPIFSDIKKLSSAVRKSYSSNIWDDLAKIDLGCGICSYTCPLCFCNETQDNFNLDEKYPCKRTRSWSSCHSCSFFKTAGHNFRPKQRDRIYNWYFHKFVRMPSEIGHVGCVDCNRCIKYCPAKINFKSVLKSLL